jgi:hypothetical protein
MAAAQLQALLRFLSQDAKVPLAIAMGKVKEFQKASLQRYANMYLFSKLSIPNLDHTAYTIKNKIVIRF